MQNTAQVISPFIDVIYVKELEAKVKNKEFLERALWVKDNHPANHSWRCNTYSSMSTNYNLLTDKAYYELVEECKVHVKEFAKHYGVLDAKVEATEGWVNVANHGAYQEYHIHPGAHFSMCYYINTPEECGNIVFKSHEADKDMFPLPAPETLTHPAHKTYWLNTTAGTVVIFKANLQHMVEINQSTEPRVGVSMNFIVR
jgi:uncharacterized protein (TIGR02466 family)